MTDLLCSRPRTKDSVILNWISVKEELPLEGRMVLVYDKHAREFREDSLVLLGGPELSWEWARIKKDVTYWMPLPRVPQAPRKKRVTDESIKEKA